MAIKINKKIIFSLIIIILLLIAGGIFWWQKIRETPIEKWEAAKVSPAEDYIITKETPEGKIVENKKMGLTYEIPKDWILENGNPERFYSPDTEFGKRRDILKKGCKIFIYGSYIKTNLDTLKKFVEADFSKFSSVIKIDEASTTKVSNYPALRYKYHEENLEMSYISVDFPSQNKLYKIALYSPTGEIERCEIEFDKFLETVSVK